MSHRKSLMLAVFPFALASSVCLAIQPAWALEIPELVLCQEVDASRRPIRATDTFAHDTESIYASFVWKDGLPGMALTANWYYETEAFHILSFSVNLTRIADRGVVSLHMPKGTPFPEGVYRLDLEKEKTVLKSQKFSVLSKP
ncbi:MAG: hypothetical protein HYT88_00740 [Candidatus Omnitrophica bacterium]|nr:hypothetical protein [Candidatus Omnitrophota bacterium]